MTLKSTSICLRCIRVVSRNDVFDRDSTAAIVLIDASVYCHTNMMIGS